MKKLTLCLGALIATLSSSLSAAPPANGKAQSGQMMNQPAGCNQMTAEEQNFCSQIMDMNNKMLFCSKFTPQQKQQAMQMMGQMDASGNMMTADQAVQQVQGAGAATSTKPKTSGGCPAK